MSYRLEDQEPVLKPGPIHSGAIHSGFAAGCEARLRLAAQPP